MITRRPPWDGIGVTAGDRRKTASYLAWLNRNVAQTLSTMQTGAILRVTFNRGSTSWRLDTGAAVSVPVPAEVAALIITKPGIVGDRDSLSPENTLSQTYRWTGKDPAHSRAF